MSSLRMQLAAEMLREGHTVDLPLRGRSMRPLIEPGLVRVSPASASSVRPGDIVLVDAGDHFVCHRLMYVAGDRIVTRGDCVSGNDELVPASAVVGRVDIPPSPLAIYCAVRALLR